MDLTHPRGLWQCPFCNDRFEPDDELAPEPPVCDFCRKAGHVPENHWVWVWLTDHWEIRGTGALVKP